MLQAILKAHEGDAESLTWIIPGLLGCAPAEGTNEANSSPTRKSGTSRR